MPTPQVAYIRRLPNPTAPRAITAATILGFLPPLGPQAMCGPVSHAITALEIDAAVGARGADRSMTLLIIFHGS